MDGGRGQVAAGGTTSTSVVPPEFLPFADGGVVFRPGTRRLLVLNAPAAVIWCLLAESSGPDELAATFATHFSIDRATAQRDVQTALDGFSQAGLLGRTAESEADEEDRFPCPAPPLPQQSARWAVQLRRALPQLGIEFCSADKLLGRWWAACLAHLPPAEGGADLRLELLPAESPDCWNVYVDGRLRIGGLARTEVLPGLMTLLFGRVSAALGDKLLFHAAVVTENGRALLLPAEAGGGKTTLAAALAAQGCGFFSDELAALDVRSLKVVPVPLPLTIKPGSARALERYYPGLAQGIFHHRADGQRALYLPPPACSRVAPHGSAPVHALVIPRYCPGTKARLQRSDKIAALRQLALTGSSARRFTTADVRAMIALVEHRASYDLIFSDVEEAVALLRERVLA